MHRRRHGHRHGGGGGLSEVVAVAAGVLEAVLAHAADAVPAECCGLLIGSTATIVRAVRARNIADDPARRFLVDPRDHIAAIRSARADDLDVCGVYHSHPRRGAEPSPTDLADATWDGMLYLIVGMHTAPPDVALFRFVEGRMPGVGPAFRPVRWGPPSGT